MKNCISLTACNDFFVPLLPLLLFVQFKMYMHPSYNCLCASNEQKSSCKHKMLPRVSSRHTMAEVLNIFHQCKRMEFICLFKIAYKYQRFSLNSGRGSNRGVSRRNETTTDFPESKRNRSHIQTQGDELMCGRKALDLHANQLRRLIIQIKRTKVSIY